MRSFCKHFPRPHARNRPAASTEIARPTQPSLNEVVATVNPSIRPSAIEENVVCADPFLRRQESYDTRAVSLLWYLNKGLKTNTEGHPELPQPLAELFGAEGADAV